MLLTSSHQIPPRAYVYNGLRYATQPLIDAGDYQALADKAGCYRHESAGPGPYTDWALTSDADGPLYQRETRELTNDEQEARLQQSREQQEITRLQARLQLLDTPDPTGQFTDAWEAVKTWAGAQGGAALAFFEDAQRWKRLDPFVIQAAPAFGWSAEDLDNLFAAAAQR